MTSSYSIAPGETAESVALKRKLAIALMQQGSETGPVQHWAQGLARMGQSALGGYELHRADEEDKAERAKGNEMLIAALSGAPAGGAQTGDAPPSPVSEPRGLRNNNPLNIEAGGFTKSQPGFEGSDGRFARFASLDQGVSAADALLQTYNRKHGINTVGGIVNRWAPPSDNNPTPAYAGHVAKALGTAPDAPVDMADPGTRQKIIAAMAQFENGQPLPQPSQQPAPQQMAQAQPPNRDKIIQMLGNRYTAPIAQGIAKDAISQQFNPKDYKPVDLGNEVGFADNRGNIARREPKKQDTDDIREYNMYAEQSRAAGQQPMSFKDYLTSIKKAGASSVTVDQRAGSEFEKEYGQGMGKRAIAILETADKAAGTIPKLQLMRTLNRGIESGRLTPGIATVGAYMQSIGVNPAALGIDPSLPAKVESFTALANEQLLGMLGPGGFPAQNFSDTDRKFMEKIQPSPGDRPETNEVKIEVAERLANLKIEKADRWIEAREQGKSYEAFERDWNKELRGRNVFGDMTARLPTVKTPATAASPADDGWREIAPGVRIREKP